MSVSSSSAFEFLEAKELVVQTQSMFALEALRIQCPVGAVKFTTEYTWGSPSYDATLVRCRLRLEWWTPPQPPSRRDPFFGGWVDSKPEVHVDFKTFVATRNTREEAGEAVAHKAYLRMQALRGPSSSETPQERNPSTSLPLAAQATAVIEALCPVPVLYRCCSLMTSDVALALSTQNFAQVALIVGAPETLVRRLVASL